VRPRAAALWLGIVAALGGCAGGRLGADADAPPARVHTYRTVESRPLRAYDFAPAGDASATPAVLLLHGGGWSAGEPSWVFTAARRFAAAGIRALAIEYRLSDSAHTPLDALADVCAALDWARTHADSLAIDPRHVAMYGVSAGGHLAAATVTVGCLATAAAPMPRGADALALLSPALDVERDGHFGRLLQGRTTARAMSPLAHPRAGMPPTIIAHGEEDTLTPLEGSQRFCLLLVQRRVACELRVYDGLGHLLTRNLAEQESTFDPDPLAREDALTKQVAFVRGLWPR
jgi:acetyl esterase